MSNRDAISRRYALFYAPASIASVLLAFFPLFRDVELEYGGRRSFGTVFDMALTPAGAPAVFGLILLASLVACLVTAAFRARSAALPGTIAGLGSTIAMMLITKPNTGEPPPDLSGTGLAGLVLVTCISALGIAHAIQLAAVKPQG